MSFSIDPAFIREEISEGSVGEQYDSTVRQVVAKAPAAYLDDLIDRVTGDIDHPLHDALDRLVADVVDLMVHEVRTGTTPDPKTLSAPTPAEPCDAWSPVFSDRG